MSLQETNNNKNQDAFSASNDVFPGGVNSPVRSFKNVGGTPLFIKRAKGAVITDLNGRKYIDFCQSWGAHLLGHAPASVVRGVRSQVKKGTSYGAPTVEELALGQAIKDLVPSMEMMRFVSSGTEAVMSALRVARAFTGRSLILKFDGGYHGHADSLLVQAGSGVADAAGRAGQVSADSEGIPEPMAALTVSVPYNDLDAVKKAFQTHKGKIAAVIVEPVAANMGLVPPQAGFLEGLKSMTVQEGALLIFDEVITGFRLGPAGGQGFFGIKPDLSTFGKILGGGLPCAAYGGRKDIMQLVAPLGPVYQAGTLSGNPLAMVAGLAMLKACSHPRTYNLIHEMSFSFYAKIEKSVEGLPLTFNRIGSLFTLFFKEGGVWNLEDAQKSDRKKFAQFYHSLLGQGIYLSPSPLEANFIGLAHTLGQLDKTAKAIDRSLKEVFAKL